MLKPKQTFISYKQIVFFLNPNITHNVICFHFVPGPMIESIPVFFNLVLNTHFYYSPKTLISKLLISILLKCIVTNLAVIFDSQDNFHNNRSFHIERVCKRIERLLILQETVFFLFFLGVKDF